MITPQSGTITIPAQTADGIWITNLVITSPSPTRPITAQIRVAPFNSTNGQIYPALGKTINIPDVTGSFAEYPSMATTMGAIIGAVNDLVSGKQLY